MKQQTANSKTAMDLDDILIHAILSAFDEGGYDAAYLIAENEDIPVSEIDKLIEAHR